MARYLDEIYVSLDSPNKTTNDTVRGRGSFGDAIQTIEASTQYGLRTVLNFCIHKMNMNEIGEVYKFAIRLGISRINFHWTSPRGRAKFHDLSLGEEEWRPIVNEVLELREIYIDKIEADIQAAFLSSRVDPTRPRSCMIKNLGNVQIFPDGRVHLCGLGVNEVDLSSIEFSSGVLRVNSNVGEIALSKRSCEVCPLRADEGENAVCIYDRN